jgi:hypothetical protein
VGRIRGSFEKTYGKKTLRPLTIHRYHPRSILEGGVFGLLNFDSSRVSELIQKGFEDAVTHDCVECGCIFPTIEELGKAAKRGEERKKKRMQREEPAARPAD